MQLGCNRVKATPGIFEIEKIKSLLCSYHCTVASVESHDSLISVGVGVCLRFDLMPIS